MENYVRMYQRPQYYAVRIIHFSTKMILQTMLSGVYGVMYPRNEHPSIDIN